MPDGWTLPLILGFAQLKGFSLFYGVGKRSVVQAKFCGN